jgi:hypothetical protein
MKRADKDARNAAIIAEFERGVSRKQLATRYHLGPQRISEILHPASVERFPWNDLHVPLELHLCDSVKRLLDEGKAMVTSG